MKKILVILCALGLALALALPAFAAGKNLIIDDMAKINESNMRTLSTYAREISDTYGMDVAFYLITNDYAPAQTLVQHVSERWPAMQDGFVLVHDPGNDWGVITFGSAQQRVTDEVADRFWAAYNEEDTYSGGALAYLQEAEAFLEQAVPANTAITPTPAAPQVLRDPASLSLLVDEANLLKDAEAATALREKLEKLSAKWENDIVIVTVDSTGGATPMDFADDWFDYNGYGRDASQDITEGDGLLLLISMEERDWWISTKGYSIFAFTDAGIEFLGKKLTDNGLSDEEYAQAFDVFADWCDIFFTRAETGKPFDKGSLPKTSADVGAMIIFALGGGMIVAWIVTGSMKKKLKSVQKKQAAADYLRPGSLQVAYANEQFLYKNVTRVKRETSSSSGGGSSTHSSSSGSSHGGGGGKF